MANNIIEEIKKGLCGDPKKDIPYIQEQGNKYKDHKDAPQILKELSELSFSLLPEENKKQVQETLFIGDKRVDQVFAQSNECVKNKDIDGAIELLKKIEENADKNFPLSRNVFFSFRNRLEEHMYVHLYKPENKYGRTPFDYSHFFSAYGYLLIEKHQPQEAVTKLEKAIKYNPINAEPKFELAEAYKLMHEPEKLLETIKETIKVAITPYYISRCYANLGYYCIEVKDYDSAVAFYYESLIYAKNPAVQGELQHIRSITGKQITPPTREEVLAVFEKYGIKNGPDQELVNLAFSLGNYCIEHNAPPQESLFYMQITYDLSRSEKVLEIVDRLKAQIAAQNAKVKQ